MFKILLSWFTGPDHQTDLDAFIASKHPTTVAEVDYWTREYDKQQYAWSRGL